MAEGEATSSGNDHGAGPEGEARAVAIDDAAVRLRLASVRVGVALSVIVAAGCAVYALNTWEEPNRAEIMVLALGTALGSPPMLLIPLRRIVESRWCEPFFIVWSALNVAVIAAAVAADGGPESPMRIMFPLPLIFAALSYPTRSVLAVGACDVLGFVLVGVTVPGPVATTMFIAFALGSTALMCIWQTRNREVAGQRLRRTASALDRAEELGRLRARQQEEIAAFGQRALAGASIARLMQDAASTTKRTLGVDIAAVLELREDGERLLISAGAGLPPGVVGEVSVPAGQGSQSGYTLASESPVIVEDWATETRFEKPEVLQQLGTRGGVTVPIKGRGKPFGVLGLQTRGQANFSSDEVSFLQAIAAALANAIDRHREEQEARDRALHDPLTGLPNRTLFTDLVSEALVDHEGRGGAPAVLFCDLDHFKAINDTLGHAAGDALLKSVPAKFEAVLRDGDTIARFGGDEFGILLPHVESEDEAAAVAAKLLGALPRPFVLDRREHAISASVGVAFGDQAESAEALIRAADAAMYRAKELGRARYEVFDAEMRTRIDRRLTIESDLRKAVEADQLDLVFQPIVELATGKLAGAEALVRWEHPEHGTLMPEDFIAIAEEGGLIGGLGRVVMGKACAAAARWQQEHPDAAPAWISVNVSMRQFSSRDFPDEVRAALSESGLEPESLNLELTEGALMEEGETVVATLAELKALGISLVLDDFGTGYSSLGYLRKFPFDRIKLDRSFVRHLGAGGVDRAIVSAVVALARTLELSVVAEGIETEKQLEVAGELGCHHAQGFHLSRPVAEKKLLALLASGMPVQQGVAHLRFE